MSIKRNTLPEPLTRSLKLPSRTKRRMMVHLTESEEALCFKESVINLEIFFQVTLPRVTQFRIALFTGLFMIFFVFGSMVMGGVPGIGSETLFTKGSSTLLVVVSIMVWLYVFVKGAWDEHVTNTRHAKAIAALYACKTFKPLTPYLQELEPQLHGYFHPNQPQDAAKFSAG